MLRRRRAPAVLLTSVSRVVAALGVTVVAGVAGACQAMDRPNAGTPDTASPGAVHATPPAETKWREIGTWSGRLSQQTESFEVSLTPMRLRWHTKNETTPGAGRFTVTLHSAVSGRPIQTLVEASGIGSATVAVADEPRWSHLVIDAVDVDWQVTLDQAVADEPR